MHTHKHTHTWTNTSNIHLTQKQLWTLKFHLAYSPCFTEIFSNHQHLSGDLMDFVIIEFHLLKMSFIGFHLIEWFSLIGTLETVNRGFFLCWCMPYTCRYIRIDRGAVISSMNVNTPHSRYRRETVRRNNWLTSFWITHTQTREKKRKKNTPNRRTNAKRKQCIHTFARINKHWMEK